MEKTPFFADEFGDRGITRRGAAELGATRAECERGLLPGASQRPQGGVSAALLRDFHARRGKVRGWGVGGMADGWCEEVVVR